MLWRHKIRWFFELARPAALQRLFNYSKSLALTRKAIQVLFNANGCHARPDSGSGKDVCSEEFAMQQGLAISRNDEDIVTFQLGDGKIVRSIGRVLVPCGIPSDNNSQKPRWFCVLKKCAAPLIMGGEFLDEIKLYTKNKHLLVKCPAWFGSMPTLKYIGAPKHWIPFSLEGHALKACADTGSDLNFMSLECATRRGLDIDYGSRRQIALADQSTTHTVGRIRASVDVGAFTDFDMEFHILPNLPCDAIFGEESVDELDAFNTCVGTLDDHNDSDEAQPEHHLLNTLVDLGPISRYLNRSWRPVANDTPQQEHDKSLEAEIHRRNKNKRLIRRILDEKGCADAEAAEFLRKQNFDRRHDNCIHCTGETSASTESIPP